MSCPHSCVTLRILIWVLSAAVTLTASIHNQDVKGALQIADQIQDVCCGREHSEHEQKNISFLHV